MIGGFAHSNLDGSIERANIHHDMFGQNPDFSSKSHILLLNEKSMLVINRVTRIGRLSIYSTLLLVDNSSTMA